MFTGFLFIASLFAVVLFAAVIARLAGSRFFLKGVLFGAILVAYIGLGIRVFTVDSPPRPVQQLHYSITPLPSQQVT